MIFLLFLISSFFKSQTKQEIREEFKSELEQSLNNLRNKNDYLLREINHLRSLLNQKQQSSNISEWLSQHKEQLLIIGRVAIVGYFIMKE
jgi:uncharacterized protein YlxW (UPF0749 family)